METKYILKSLTALFIFLNILVLIGGYVVIDWVFKQKANLNMEANYYLKKEEDVLSKVDIVKNSNEDLYANIQVLKANLESLKEDTNELSLGASDYQSNVSSLESQLASANNVNSVLRSKIMAVQNQLSMQNALSSRTNVITTRTTRSS